MISVSLGLTWYTILWYIIECGGIYAVWHERPRVFFSTLVGLLVVHTASNAWLQPLLVRWGWL